MRVKTEERRGGLSPQKEVSTRSTYWFVVGFYVFVHIFLNLPSLISLTPRVTVATPTPSVRAILC